MSLSLDKLPPDLIGCETILRRNTRYLELLDPEHSDFDGRYLHIVRRKAGLPVPDDAPGLPVTYRGPGGVLWGQPANRVVLRCYLEPGSGYTTLAEWVGRGLNRLGLPVVYDPMAQRETEVPLSPFIAERSVKGAVEPWVLQIAGPRTPLQGGRASVVFTMHEIDRLDKESVEHLNQAAAVVVPSVFCKDTFQRSGVTRPVHVVPLGVSPDEGFRPRERPPVGICRFGLAGRMGDGGLRKAINEGVEAFEDAFDSDDMSVALSIWVWPDDVKELSLPEDPRIEVIADTGTTEQLANWYRSLTAYLVPARGEGWGLHTLQAMACGVPVAAIPWSGTVDFWHESSGWEIDYDLVPAVGYYQSGGNWAQPFHDSLVAVLRRIRENPEEVTTKGKAAALLAAEFTWERTARELRAVLEGVGMARKTVDSVAAVSPELAARVKACPHRKPAPQNSCGCLAACTLGKYGGTVTEQHCLDCQREQEAAEPKKYPSLWEQATSAAKSAVGFAASGFKMASMELVEQRLTVCRACDRYDAAPKRCRECGCFVEVKARAETAVCPIGRW